MSKTPSLQFVHHSHPSPLAADKRAELLKNPGFGRVFSDHMVTIRYHESKGWYDARVEARAPIPMDPAAAVLHYAQEVFEGLKAYRLPDGGMALFRPHENAKRLNLSASRMAMPELPEALFIEALETLVSLEKDWTPDGEGSLYLRPFMIATEAFLGVRPANEYLFCIIASIAKLKGKDFEVLTPETALADKIYDHLTKLQRGQTNDPHGWVYRIA